MSVKGIFGSHWSITAENLRDRSATMFYQGKSMLKTEETKESGAFYIFQPGPAFLPKANTWICPITIITIQMVE
jgi:hypothetical protein